MFAIKILQNVERFRKQKLLFKQNNNTKTIFAKNAVTRAIKLFMNNVNHNLSDSDQKKKQN